MEDIMAIEGRHGDRRVDRFRKYSEVARGGHASVAEGTRDPCDL